MIKDQVAKWISVWFGSGLSPKMPGTVGSAAALPFIWLAAYWGGIAAVAGLAAVTIIVGIWAADRYAGQLGREDPGCIVIDEVAGQSLTLLAAGTNLWLFAVGFVLFRVLDISKPGPIGWADRKVHGGLGIMLDDVIAGVIGGAVIAGIRFWM